jgi:hypothetical protein
MLPPPTRALLAQYLVVCVPNAFASSLETWFGRIVDSRAAGSGGSGSGSGSGSRAVPSASAAVGALCALGSAGGGGAAAGADSRSESTWDSSMYMKRLGQVLDTLQARVLCEEPNAAFV